ncbi:MAG: hypothetical protein CEO12_102 [Parcubacteria group bacterium Gr01-1014_46]|nr:MAG: hypothetical protein CEO12_102 [Parcubacteria group bacterium Gr01-1014_46]
MSIAFDYFSFSVLMGGFVALLSGFVVYLHNNKKTENIAWFIFNISSAVWSFGYFVLINAPDKNIAFYSSWFLHIAAILVPLSCLLSIVAVTNTYKVHRNGIIISSIVGLFLIISTPSKLFVEDYVPKGTFNYMVEVGPIYNIFTLYFFGLVVYVLSVLYKKYSCSRDLIEISRYKYMMLFTAIGSIGGGSVFFLNYNVHILPYPLILFSLFPVVSLYAIFKFQLFDTKVVTTEAIVFFLWIFIIIRTLQSNSLTDLIINVGLLSSLVVVGIFLIRSVIKEVSLRENIEKLAEDLQKANQGQSNLIHFMNHQVKGRFGNAKNIFAELLTDDYGEMPEGAKPLLQKGLEETTTGVDYVQSILHGASAEMGTLPYEMVDMNFKEIVEDRFSKQKEYAENKGLSIKLDIADGDYSIKGDKTQLGESVKNLIDNSINYTKEGSIDVSLSVDNMIRLKIKDTGVGISDEDKPKLFKSGGRGTESLKINVNSTGYGLAFVKGVVDAHKGRVWAESEGPGKGSTFYVELPKNN